MSLDVYLTLPDYTEPERTVIYIRENGATREITQAEWQARYPEREPVTTFKQTHGEVYTANITHNLNTMAMAAGIYEPLWRPDEIDITHAYQLIEPLTVGLAKLLAYPDYFAQYNPPNGWGTYAGLVKFVQGYLQACRAYPQAEVSVWR